MCTNLLISMPNIETADQAGLDTPPAPIYVSSRCLEMPGVIEQSVYVVAAGESWPLPSATTPPFVSNPYKWQNHQNFVGIAPSGAASNNAPYSSELAWDTLPTFNDGLNASGVSIGALWLEPGANYARTSHTTDSYEMSYLDFPAWVLGTCTSVNDIKTALIGPDALFTVVGPAPSNTDNFYVPLHYVATDAEGQSVVVEFVGPTEVDGKAVGGRTTIYDSNGVMTNAPEYAWHLVNVENYAHLSLVGAATTKTGGGDGKPLVGGGLQGMPGDAQSASRFIKAWYMSKGFSQMQANGNTWLPAPGGVAPTNDDPSGFAYAQQTAVVCAVQLVQIAMGTPYGMLLEYQEQMPPTTPPTYSTTELTFGDWTMWTCARDHTNVAYYFMSGLSGILTKIDVAGLFEDPPQQPLPTYPDNLALPVLPQPDAWCFDATKDLASAT